MSGEAAMGSSMRFRLLTASAAPDLDGREQVYVIGGVFEDGEGREMLHLADGDAALALARRSQAIAKDPEFGHAGELLASVWLAGAHRGLAMARDGACIAAAPEAGAGEGRRLN